jgi:L1 cell adhesion molecule like protein
LNIKITRAKLEDLCQELFKNCLIPVEQVLENAEMSRKDIEDIVLIGGSTRIPKIKEILRNYFDKEPKTEINPDEAVAYGASIQGALLNNIKDDVLDNFLLLDVTPLSLGLETANNLMTTIISKNTTIPCEVEKIFSTHSDNQTNVNIKIYEGEKAYAKDNNLLGSFDLINLRPALRGELKIKVKFNIDANNILTVSALEEYSNVSNNITINNEKDNFAKETIEKILENQKETLLLENKTKEFINSKNSLINYLKNIKLEMTDDYFKNKLKEQYKIKYTEINKIINNNLDIVNNITNIEEIDIIKEIHKELENKIFSIINDNYNN